jgi:hypothetical protein
MYATNAILGIKRACIAEIGRPREPSLALLAIPGIRQIWLLSTRQFSKRGVFSIAVIIVTPLNGTLKKAWLTVK